MASRGQLMQRACGGHTRMLAAEWEPEGPEQSENMAKWQEVRSASSRAGSHGASQPGHQGCLLF